MLSWARPQLHRAFLSTSRSLFRSHYSSLHYRNLYTFHSKGLNPHLHLLSSAQLRRFSGFRSYRPKKDKQTPEDTKKTEPPGQNEQPAEEKKDEEQDFSTWSKEQFQNFQAEEPDKKDDKNSNDEDPGDSKASNQLLMALGLGAAVFAGVYQGLLGSEEQALKEISFHEFLHGYLLKKDIEKLVILKRSIVNVHLRGEKVASVSFSISSIRIFEDVLYNAQVDAGVQPSKLIPVSFSFMKLHIRQLYTTMTSCIVLI